VGETWSAESGDEDPLYAGLHPAKNKTGKGNK
jgi:hypothetical protein